MFEQKNSFRDIFCTLMKSKIYLFSRLPKSASTRSGSPARTSTNAVLPVQNFQSNFTSNTRVKAKNGSQNHLFLKKRYPRIPHGALVAHGQRQGRRRADWLPWQPVFFCHFHQISSNFTKFSSNFQFLENSQNSQADDMIQFIKDNMKGPSAVHFFLSRFFRFEHALRLQNGPKPSFFMFQPTFWFLKNTGREGGWLAVGALGSPRLYGWDPQGPPLPPRLLVSWNWFLTPNHPTIFPECYNRIFKYDSCQNLFNSSRNSANVRLYQIGTHTLIPYHWIFPSKCKNIQSATIGYNINFRLRDLFVARWFFEWHFIST